VVATGRRMKGVERLMICAIELVADALLSARAAMQKPYDVSESRHTAAAIS
jgi:hypothetical protein